MTSCFGLPRTEVFPLMWDHQYLKGGVLSKPRSRLLLEYLPALITPLLSFLRLAAPRLPWQFFKWSFYFVVYTSVCVTCPSTTPKGWDCISGICMTLASGTLYGLGELTELRAAEQLSWPSAACQLNGDSDILGWELYFLPSVCTSRLPKRNLVCIAIKSL